MDICVPQEVVLGALVAWRLTHGWMGHWGVTAVEVSEILPSRLVCLAFELPMTEYRSKIHLYPAREYNKATFCA